MPVDPLWLQEQADLALERLLPATLAFIEDETARDTFEQRLGAHFATFFELYLQLYGQQHDFYHHLGEALRTCATMYAARSPALKQLDNQREQNQDWFQSNAMLGGVCYVDLFAGTLEGLRGQIPYLRELGLTYLHLMPLFKCPQPRNDGGYAVSSFREVNPTLGTMEDLARLTHELREVGISLCVDFVFNHTSDEHDWALQALKGEKRYQRYYRMFNSRTLPDLYEPYLREIFPEQAPGSFTYRADIQKWVWTTFYPFQWDLNYENPDLFNAMLGEMLFLANQGIEVLRLDAVPFIWKQLGTNCENLPQAHTIIRAYNALMRIAAPALLFKSEAIVHPRDVRSYIAPEECPLSYNPIMMVSLWEAIATRETTFFTHTMQKQFPLPTGTAWLNYIRSHDDIGWGFADEDAVEVGINGFDHRNFLNQFYTGRFEGSFAIGLPFNYNPINGDMRICGTTASLVGIEQALKQDNTVYLNDAINRLLLILSVTLSAGGIPLLYLGDEVGTLNDYRYQEDPNKVEDNRWVHRPPANAAAYRARDDAKTVSGRVFQALHRLIQVRKTTPVLQDGHTRFFHVGNRHVLGYSRHDSLLVLANFSEQPQMVNPALLEASFPMQGMMRDLVSGADADMHQPITLQPYQFMWLTVGQ